MNIALLITVLLTTFVFGMILLPYVSSVSRELKIYDLPDKRKVHSNPTPRTGGFTFLPVVTLTIALIQVAMLRYGFNLTDLWKVSDAFHFPAYFSGAMMIFAIGMYDDIIGVSYKPKFAVQIIASIMLCISGLWIATMDGILFVEGIPFWIGMPLTVMCVIYITNSINLIDGIDGLASGLSCIALLVSAILHFVADDIAWAAMSVAFLGVVMAFFYYNVFSSKNRLFMGDTGSLTLGFTLSFLIIHFWQLKIDQTPFYNNLGIVALSTLVIPLFDVVRVFLSRLHNGKNPFLPDKNHIHHKLMRAGLNQSQTLIAILLMDVIIIATDYFIAFSLSKTLMVAVDILVYMAMILAINYFIEKRAKG